MRHESKSDLQCLLNKQGKLFSNPVILIDPHLNPEGVTEEKEDVLTQGTELPPNYVKNIALQQVIEEYQKTGNRLDQLDQKTLYCNIKQDIPQDPVVLLDGLTYEKLSLENWLTSNTTSPITSHALKHKNYVPNKNLHDFINNTYIHFAPHEIKEAYLHSRSNRTQEANEHKEQKHKIQLKEYQQKMRDYSFLPTVILFGLLNFMSIVSIVFTGISAGCLSDVSIMFDRIKERCDDLHEPISLNADEFRQSWWVTVPATGLFLFSTVFFFKQFRQPLRQWQSFSDTNITALKAFMFIMLLVVFFLQDNKEFAQSAADHCFVDEPTFCSDADMQRACLLDGDTSPNNFNVYSVPTYYLLLNLSLVLQWLTASYGRIRSVVETGLGTFWKPPQRESVEEDPIGLQLEATGP